MNVYKDKLCKKKKKKKENTNDLLIEDLLLTGTGMYGWAIWLGMVLIRTCNILI